MSEGSSWLAGPDSQWAVASDVIIINYCLCLNLYNKPIPIRAPEKK